MAIIYFLQSDVVPTLLAAGVEVILLTDDDINDKIAARFAPRPDLRGPAAETGQRYARHRRQPRWQWLLAYLRRVGGSWRINTEAQDQPHLGSLGRELRGSSAWGFGCPPRWRL